MPTTHAPGIQVTVFGAPLPQAVAQSLVSAVVDDSVNLPGCVELRFLDGQRRTLKDGGFEIGAEVGVSLPGPTKALEPVITVEVTGLEVEMAKDSAVYTVVRGLEKSHRLFRGRRTAAYLNATYADVVKKVAGRAGLKLGKIDATSTVHDLVTQAGTSDWEFLSRLAGEIGYEICYTDGSVDFRKPQAAAQAPAGPDPLRMGENLRRLRGAVTAAEQVAEAVVRSWDPGTKKALVGTAATANRAADAAGVTPDAFAKKFHAPRHESVHVPYGTQAEVDAAARTLAEHIADTCVELEGVADGNARLLAGSAVTVELAGQPFDGRYVLTRTRHLVDEDGYTVAFTVSGHHDRSLLGLASVSTNGGSQPLAGVVPAIVTDVRDPEKRARVKVKFPWLADDYQSDWTRVVHFGAGKTRGAIMVPEVNDEVLVAFEHGDFRRPYVLGGLYNGVDTPALGDGLVDGGGNVTRRAFFSRTGHKLVFSDDTREPGVTLVTTKGLQLDLDDTNRTVRIVSKGKVEVQADGDVAVTAQGNATVKAGGNATVEATANLELKGNAGVKVESTGLVQIKGSPVKIN